MNQQQYKKYYKAAIKITSDHNDAQDLMHDVLIMLTKNEKYNNLSDTNKFFFFIRTMMNQYRSNSSHYTRNYKKYNFEELKTDFNIQDSIYEEQPSLDWIRETMDQEIEVNPDFWYDRGIFELWLSHKGFIERVHKQTRIPRYSIKETIEKTKLWINKKWEKYKDGTDQIG
jgi:hypothetical protein